MAKKLFHRIIWVIIDCQLWPKVKHGLYYSLAQVKELTEVLQHQYCHLAPLGELVSKAKEEL